MFGHTNNNTHITITSESTKCSPTGIFCPGICDKNNGLANIDRKKVEWMSSNGLLKLRKLFGVEYGYGRMMNTSGRGNEARELTSIKPG